MPRRALPRVRPEDGRGNLLALRDRRAVLRHLRHPEQRVFLGDGGSPFCFCPYTIAAWNKDHPGDDYREGFKTKDGWLRRYRWFKKRSMIDILDATRPIAKRHRPTLKSPSTAAPSSCPDEVQQKVDFLYSEEVEFADRHRLGGDLRPRLGAAGLPIRRVRLARRRGPQQRRPAARPDQCPRRSRTHGTFSSARPR